MKLIKEIKKKRGSNTGIQNHVKEAVIKFKIAKQSWLAIILNALLKYQKGDSKLEYPIHVLVNWINALNISEKNGE
ncbi:MAG: hypothetical protein EAX96_20760 [Candidatus Lokiarchaeota archaeon]|nr:hypothetical protein [Candidatus Lokiarchaeota archaeon]